MYSSIVRYRAWLYFGVVALGCGTSEQSVGGSSSSGTNSGSSGSIGGGTKDAGEQDTSDCADTARLVYVVSAQDDLYSFAPDKGAFTKVGTLTCAAGGATPNSMAIDRSGTAWVNYTDGTLWKVSTENASCQATTFQPNQAGFLKMGMAFSKGAKAKSETLYIVGLDGANSSVGKGFGTIDLETMQLTMLGDFSGELAGRGAELTGTGDGRLFGFFTTKPASLAQINGASGATTGTTPLNSVNTGESWAFSFWGGDFWFYTSPSKAASSTVTRLARSKDDALTVTNPDVGGFRIVGAGVSTCAPVVPPDVK